MFKLILLYVILIVCWSLKGSWAEVKFNEPIPNRKSAELKSHSTITMEKQLPVVSLPVVIHLPQFQPLPLVRFGQINSQRSSRPHAYSYRFHPCSIGSRFHLRVGALGCWHLGQILNTHIRSNYNLLLQEASCWSSWYRNSRLSGN